MWIPILWSNGVVAPSSLRFIDGIRFAFNCWCLWPKMRPDTRSPILEPLPKESIPNRTSKLDKCESSRTCAHKKNHLTRFSLDYIWRSAFSIRCLISTQMHSGQRPINWERHTNNCSAKTNRKYRCLSYVCPSAARWSLFRLEMRLNSPVFNTDNDFRFSIVLEASGDPYTAFLIKKGKLEDSIGFSCVTYTP